MVDLDAPSFITTHRLLLQPLTESDDEFIFELVNTEGWLQFIGNRNIHSREEARGYIQKILSNKNIFYWVVRGKVEQVAMGIITFIQRDYLDHPDIGFAFLPQFSKKGYAYEATTAVLQKIIPEQNLQRILAVTVSENINSIQLLKKLGLSFEKEMKVENKKLCVFGASANQLKFLHNLS